VCLVLIASDPRPGIRLVVGANRDEFHARPTAPAARWPDLPCLVAGKDLTAGGTWLGVTEDGRFAALTNFRDGKAPKADRSRGELVLECLRDERLDGFFAGLPDRLASYGGFNLIAGRPGKLRLFSSRTRRHDAIPPGVHALSNHDLDTPWPKVTRTKEALARLAASSRPFDVEGLFDILSDRTIAPDRDLPDTGVGLALERFLSAPFIVGPEYGTRSSTIAVFRTDGVTELFERTFDPLGKETGTVSLRLVGRER
jgi:uncharacterized protein with NRDE domain